MYLNRQQLKKLKKLKRKDITRDVRQYDPVLEYLIEKKLVNYTEVDRPGDYMYHAQINEHGKAYLYDHFLTSTKSTAAILVAVISACFSLLSLSLSVMASLDDIIRNLELLLSLISW